MRYLFLLFLIVAGSVYGQSYYKNVITDRVTVNFPDHKIDATVAPYRGKIILVPENFYYWYSANKIHITQGGYSGKLLNGPYSDFYANKNLKEKGAFKKGLKTKQWNAWNEKGFLQETINWKAGRKNGKYYRYDAEGVLKESGRYRNDFLKGKITIYTFPDSSNSSYYKKGKVITKKKRKFVPRFIQRRIKERK